MDAQTQNDLKDKTQQNTMEKLKHDLEVIQTKLDETLELFCRTIHIENPEVQYDIENAEIIIDEVKDELSCILNNYFNETENISQRNRDIAIGNLIAFAKQVLDKVEFPSFECQSQIMLSIAYLENDINPNAETEFKIELI